jgi:hypothetical protein
MAGSYKEGWRCLTLQVEKDEDEEQRVEEDKDERCRRGGVCVAKHERDCVAKHERDRLLRVGGDVGGVQRRAIELDWLDCCM